MEIVDPLDHLIYLLNIYSQDLLGFPSLKKCIYNY
jgi:hypothetical protein